MPNPVPDRDLLASDGDAAGFRIFYERHVHAVVAYVARRMHKPDLVLDVVAETFARALERRGQYDASRGPAVAWLFGLARNEIASAVRRGRVADDYRTTARVEMQARPTRWRHYRAGRPASMSDRPQHTAARGSAALRFAIHMAKCEIELSASTTVLAGGAWEA
jgi:DNA-directed RNA polymerase specialized sigma24 family protein